MSLEIVETIRATWLCDWCGTSRVRQDKEAPEDSEGVPWIRSDDPDDGPGDDMTFCSGVCRSSSEAEWGMAWDEAMNYQYELWVSARAVERLKQG